MEKKAAAILVQKHFERVASELGLTHWRVDVDFSEEEEDTVASCLRLFEYQKARVNVDLSKIESEAQFLEEFRHELVHLVLAPFDAYRNAIVGLVGEDEKMMAVLDSVWDMAVEQVVTHLERIIPSSPERA